MRKLFRLLTLTLVLCSLLAVALPITVAQEHEATEEVAHESEAIVSEGAVAEPSSTVPGVSAAMLFLGAGAIVVVGLLMIARDNFTGETES